MKPGIETTEFWTMLASAVVGLLAVFGVIQPADQSEMVKQIVVIAGAVLAIINSVSYIVGRVKIKVQALKQEK